jgi:hypothetical protein
MVRQTFAGIGQTGRFEIRPGGHHPELGDSFHYEDPNHQFWFYTLFKVPPEIPEPTLFVDYSTVREYAGPRPNLGKGDLATIEQNIRDYFERFNFIGRPIRESDPVSKIIFSWRFPLD